MEPRLIAVVVHRYYQAKPGGRFISRSKATVFPDSSDGGQQWEVDTGIFTSRWGARNRIHEMLMREFSIPPYRLDFVDMCRVAEGTDITNWIG